MNTNSLYVTEQLRFIRTITKLQHSCGGENKGEIRERKNSAMLIIQLLISLFLKFFINCEHSKWLQRYAKLFSTQRLLKESCAHRHYCAVVGPEIGSPHEGSVPWSSPWGAAIGSALSNVPCTDQRLHLPSSCFDKTLSPVLFFLCSSCLLF